MILDGLLLFSSAQQVLATAASTNVVDMTNARDLGIGNDYPAMKLMIQITTAFATADAGTLQVQFQGSTDNSTYTTYAESDAYAAALLTAGQRHLLPIHLPARKPGAALPRYYRVNYVVANNFTAGNLTAALVIDRQDNHQYPAGLTVAN